MATGKKKTVVVGMSGGVDSSVAAALLKEQGFDVIGITMKTYDFDEVGGNVANETSCCGLGAMNDARLVAAQIGIPHYVVDFRESFGRHVIDNFVDEYLQGRTPNPCVICNREIKWGELLRKAEALGADFLATGHYARLRFDSERGRHIVSRSTNEAKDQSYALWGLSQAALGKTMFPLGEMKKQDVRDLARRFGLRTAAKAESFEICFVADDKYDRFLKERVPDLESKVASGDIVMDGKVVGKHSGYPFYTIGQRRGIGAFGKPVYVTEIQKETNTIQIGSHAQLLHRTLHATGLNLVSRESLVSGMTVEAKVRYKDDPSPARVFDEGSGSFRVEFDTPKRAITPGQSVVLYENGDLLGGGIIGSVSD
ncbi:MAG TPA: tRNA 2-thiouridine(34) synthase MnmA [Bacteroidota bacterium]|nr:tRNA 2-thiouridine(34) synthase MnmA [Bacteroidota bacterium]